MRNKAFLYVVEKDGTATLVKAVSPGRAVKAALNGVKVRRASSLEAVDYINAGVALIDATKEEPKHVASKR